MHCHSQCPINLDPRKAFSWNNGKIFSHLCLLFYLFAIYLYIHITEDEFVKPGAFLIKLQWGENLKFECKSFLTSKLMRGLLLYIYMCNIERERERNIYIYIYDDWSCRLNSHTHSLGYEYYTWLPTQNKVCISLSGTFTHLFMLCWTPVQWRGWWANFVWVSVKKCNL